MTLALVTLAAATFFLAEASILGACLLGAVGYAAIMTWAPLGGGA